MKKFIDLYVGVGYQLEINNDITDKEIMEAVENGIFLEELAELVGTDDIIETDSTTEVLIDCTNINVIRGGVNEN
jgi:hypothetical protein